MRIATVEDGPAIETLMRVSGDVLFRRFYDERQAKSAVRYVSSVDPMLLEDGTYFVIEAAGELVACGGWSRRAKLYTGAGDAEGDDRLLDPATEAAHIRAMYTRPDWTRRGLGRRILEACVEAARADGYRKMTLGATLPGLPLYEAFGFRETGREDIRMPDGVSLACVWMDLPID